MTEKQPRPEKEPKVPKLRDDCSNCEKEYRITKVNSVYFTYAEFPEADNLVCRCPNCKFITRIFVPLDSETRGAIPLNKIPNIISKNPNYDTMKSYLEIYEVPIIKSHDITPRQENVIKFARYLLESNLVTVEEFWDSTKDLYEK